MLCTINTIAIAYPSPHSSVHTGTSVLCAKIEYIDIFGHGTSHVHIEGNACVYIHLKIIQKFEANIEAKN